MENASKALIIAGAILISILLIGLGVYFYNMAAGTGRSVNLDDAAAQAQNSKFDSYFGDRKSSQDVKNLMSQVRSNNITGDTGDEEKTIYLLYNGTKSSASEIQKAVKPGNTYWINVENDKAATDEELKSEDVTATSSSYYPSGFIRVISIKDNKATTGGSGAGGGT